MGTVVLTCNTQAKVQAQLYYQSSTALAPSGMICICDSCGAAICTDPVCWGATPDSTSPQDLSEFISSLRGDFAYYIRAAASVSAFAWDGTWEVVNGLYAVQVSFVRLDLEDTVVSQILSTLVDNTGVADGTYGMVVTYDGELAGESTAYIYIGDPSAAEDELGGYIDVLFFGGINEEPQCNIHDQCGKYRCYAYRNLIGEYSGDNHIQEGECVRNIQPTWGYVSIKIDTTRESGTYRMGCDELCLFCAYEGSFEGDQCVCAIGGATNYNCISVKYAASALLIPSAVMLLILSVLSMF